MYFNSLFCARCCFLCPESPGGCQVPPGVSSPDALVFHVEHRRRSKGEGDRTKSAEKSGLSPSPCPCLIRASDNVTPSPLFPDFSQDVRGIFLKWFERRPIVFQKGLTFAKMYAIIDDRKGVKSCYMKFGKQATTTKKIIG